MSNGHWLNATDMVQSFESQYKVRAFSKKQPLSRHAKEIHEYSCEDVSIALLDQDKASRACLVWKVIGDSISYH